MGRSNIPKQQKRETMHRLVDEGLWELACQRREELRGGGMTADEAWIRMEEEFPPIEEPEPTVEDEAEDVARQAEITELIARSKGVTRSILDDMKWGLDRMADPEVSPADAPTAASYQMWTWSQEHPSHFMKIAINKLMSREEEKQREKELQKDLGLPKIRQMIADLEKKQEAEA